MTEKVFIVEGGGDREVGITDINATITIKDNYSDEDDEQWVKNWKEFLTEYYDVSENLVFTKKEYDLERKLESEIYSKEDSNVGNQ